MTLSVGTRELKNRLTEYLRLVSGGSRVLVTNHGVAVAELRPVGAVPERDALDTWLERLASSGQIRPPAACRLPAFRAVTIRGRPMSKTVVEDRR